MKTRKTGSLPAPLERTRRRFERWRQSREGRTAIPDSLWAAAVKVAGRYGICQTAKALRLGYYSLKKRVEQEADSSAGSLERESEPTFLQLAVASPAGVAECILEWEDAAGAKMRVHLKGVKAPDLVALSRSFWEVER